MKTSVYFLFLLLLGCPPPEWLHMEYYSRGKFVKKCELELVDGKCVLTITGRTHRLSNSVVQLFIEAKFQEQEAADFKFKLNSPKLFIDKKLVPYPSSSRIHQPNPGTRREYISPFPELPYYDFVATNNEVKIDDVYGIVHLVNLEIVLDSFVFYKDSLILIDTIQGMFY